MDSKRSESFPSMLRITLSKSASQKTIQNLHKTRDAVPKELSTLFHDAGVEKLSPVYELKEDELKNDEHGFAREFKIYIKPEVDPEEAVTKLRKSDLIEKVQPVATRFTSN